jgi:anaerobic magnesium-protoporphyrin IX monomethyl ester cyclase
MKNRTCILYGYTPIDLKVLNEYGAGPGINPYQILPSFQEGSAKHISVPSLGPVALASFLQQHAIPVTVYDYYRDNEALDNFDIFGISSTFLTMTEVKTMAADIRSKNSDAPIVLGGPISWSYSPDELFKIIPELHFIVVQEGESAFLSLIDAIVNDKQSDGIPGVVTKHGTSMFPESRTKFHDLETLPFPDWSLIDFKDRLKVIPVETSRGCLYNCAFCNETNYWGKPVRQKGIEGVLSELKTNIATYGITTFRFVDSCFSAPVERCSAICDAITEQIINNGIPLRWSAYARLNNLSGTLLAKMKKSGCVALDVGWESGNPGILEKMNKRYDPEKVIECVRIAKELEIFIHCNTVIGFPGETQNTINDTVDILEIAQPNTYQCLYLYLSPHSHLYDHAEEYGINGTRHTWQHASMNSDEAEQSIRSIRTRLKNIPMFAGGEFFSCYLASLNFSYHEITDFFQAINNIMNSVILEKDTQLIQKVDSAFKRYW